MPKVHRGSSKRKDANLNQVYDVNTLCFARVRGYQPWPARIIERKNGNKYQVRFFGTYDNATVATDSIYPFNAENLKKYGGQRGSSLFKRAMEEVKSAPEVCDVDSQGDMTMETENTDDVSFINEDGKVSDGIFYDTREEDPNPRVFISVKYDKSHVKDLIDEGVPMDPLKRKLLESKEEKTEEEKEQLKLALINEVFQEKIRFFTFETMLNELVYNFKVCLAKDKPYLSQGLDILKSISKIPFDPVLVKKVPELFSVLEQSRRYVGVSGIADAVKKQQHRSLVREIQELSEQLTSRLLNVLQIEMNSDYSREAEKRLHTFKERTRLLTETQRMLLTSEKELKVN